MKNCSQCGEPLEAGDKFCPKCGKPQTQAAEPKPKVIFEVPPTIEFLNKALSERKIDLAKDRNNKALVWLFLSVDQAIDEPARQVLQKLDFDTTSIAAGATPFGSFHGQAISDPEKILPCIPREDDRYELIAEEFDKYFVGYGINTNPIISRISPISMLMSLGIGEVSVESFLRGVSLVPLAVLAVLAAFDGVYSANEKKLIRRFVRLWNKARDTQNKIETSTLEALETAIVRLCENENKRREIRGSSKNYQQITLELSAIAKTDEEIVNGLFIPVIGGSIMEAIAGSLEGFLR